MWNMGWGGWWNKLFFFSFLQLLRKEKQQNIVKNIFKVHFWQKMQLTNFHQLFNMSFSQTISLHWITSRNSFLSFQGLILGVCCHFSTCVSAQTPCCEYRSASMDALQHNTEWISLNSYKIQGCLILPCFIGNCVKHLTNCCFNAKSIQSFGS